MDLTNLQTLMDNNQALKAWDLVKDLDDPIKDRVWLKVKHAFDDKAYRKYYEEDLVERPIKEERALDCARVWPRFEWLVPRIVKDNPSSVLDIGCADGYLGLTLGKWGIASVGLNLYKPSVDVANERAAVNNLPAKFLHTDFRDYNEQHEVVVFFEILEHLPNPKASIEKAYSLVKPGGKLYISTPRDDHKGIEEHLRNENREGWDDGKPSGHLFLLSEKELRELLKDYKINEFNVDWYNNMEVEIEKSST